MRPKAGTVTDRGPRMSWEAWVTLAVVMVTIWLLVLDVTAPGAIVLGAVVVLLVSDVLRPAEAFAGFGNPAPITVAALYVVAAGIERTGVLNGLVRAMAGRSLRHRVALSRMVLPSAAASAFLNNTPVVAMLVPAVTRWSERVGRSAADF